MKYYFAKHTSKFCWSHGICSHTSKDYKVKVCKEGYNECASFYHKMGGSTAYCQKFKLGTDDKSKIKIYSA